MGAHPGLKEEQVKKAVAALLKYTGNQKEGSKNLLEEDELLHLVRIAHFICIS
jgi:hypothetical protein